MARKLASVLVSLALLSPVGVQALGLGGIELNSFLNQPLDAQIEILSSKKGESDGMQVKLASPEAFAKAGLEYNTSVRQLKFNVIRKASGKQYIKVSTRKGFREPFLNFLLEVNWANGRIMREYAELVDPPSLVQSSQPAAQIAPVGRSAPSAPTRRTQAPAAPTYTSGTTADTRGFIGDTYTTRRNDTAYKIARDARPDNQVTVEQSMMALLRANPSAFINQNINRLKAGYTLNIPDRESMLSQSHSDALAEVRRQTREWRDSTRTAATTTPRGRLEILPPQSAGDSASQTDAADSGDANRDAMLAREAAEAQRQENAELRLRISELEEQIENASRLAQLKSDQLAALEKKLGEVNEADAAPTTPEVPVVTETEADAETAAETPAAEIPDVEVETAEAEAPAAEAETPAETPAEAAPQYSEVVEAVPAQPGTPINQHIVSGFSPVELDSLPKSELPAQPFKTTAAEAPATDTVAEESASLVDRALAYFKQNPMVKWIAAGAGGLLVLILGLMMARRGKGEQQFEESILHEPKVDEATELAEETQAMTEEATATDDLFETVDVDQADETKAEDEMTDTSFLSDMVLSDMSDLQEGAESDPLTEADVFLAYGRFGPAENMIKGAIAKEPERHDLKLKLLEIYYSSKNKEAFEQEAAALHADLENNPDPETWEKVVEMGEDLCPDNSLFTAGVATAAVAAAGAALSSDDEDTEIMDFDLGEFEDQIESMEGAPQAESIEDGLDIDLGEVMADADLDEELDDTLEFTAELNQAKDEALDSGLDKTTELTAEMEQQVDQLTESVSEKADITRRIVTDQTSTQDEITEELKGIADVLKTDAAADTIEPEITRKIVQEGGAANEDVTQELDVPDLETVEDFTADATLPIDEDLDLDDETLSDIDEVGTKLDLARAYIDMGDPEGARSILGEVVEEGNDNQKSEAEQLLNQI